MKTSSKEIAGTHDKKYTISNRRKRFPMNTKKKVPGKYESSNIYLQNQKRDL